MNRTKLTFTVLFLTLSVISSCKKHDEPPSTPVTPPPTTTKTYPSTGPWLYIGGAINSTAAYWKISLSAAPTDTMTILFPNASRVISIAATDSDVYVAAPANNKGYYQGIYWKNGVAVPIPTAGQIDYIAISGSNVYAYGIDSPNANLAYWTNGFETSLPIIVPTGVGLSYEPSGIAVSGTDVYTSASLSFIQSYGADTTFWGNSAVYWKNGTINYLSNHGYGGILYQSTTGIAATGTDVYVAGNIDIDADTMAWCGYWKDTTKITLFSRSGYFTYGAAYSIALSGTDVYVTGTLLNNGATSAVYWKDGAMTTLPGGAQATAITFSGSDVYILGNDTIGNSVVWKNNALFVNLGQVVTTSLAAAP